MIGIFAQYFSEKYFDKSVAENMFLRQKSKKEAKSAKIEDMFCKIKISSSQLFLDPIIAFFFRFSSCESFSCRKRHKLLEKSRDKLGDELGIESFLKQLRTSKTVLQSF